MKTGKSNIVFGVCAAILLLVLSCTIIEDSDITSLAEYNKLSLKSIEINQETLAGNSTKLALLKYDSVQNFVDSNTGARITRLQRFTLPSLGTLKMKLRSGTTTNTEFFIYFKEDGLPYTFGIFAGDSLVEHYSFRYNASNQLNKIRTRLNPIDGRPATLVTTDTLTYSPSPEGKLVSMTRKGVGSFTFQFGTYNSEQTLSSMTFLGQNYNIYTGNCSNGFSSNVCGQLYKPVGNGGYTVHNEIQLTLGKTTQTTITDQRLSNSGCDCQRELDTYYLHPLMILRYYFPQGGMLLWIYTVDWWKPGTAQLSAQKLNKNDVVKLNFNYGQ